MKPVRADFAPRVVPSRALWLALLALSLGAIAAGVAVVHRKGEVARLRVAIETAAAEQAAAVIPVKQASPPPYEQSARDMLAERELAWPAVLTALEATAIVGVTPTSVELSAGDGVVRVEVGFADHAKLLEYVESLNAGETILRWNLVQAQAQAAGGHTAVLQSRASSRAPSLERGGIAR